MYIVIAEQQLFFKRHLNISQGGRAERFVCNVLEQNFNLVC